MNQFGLLGVFAGIAVATALFLASYLIFIRKEQVFKNRLLGFIFIAIALRVGKSIAYFILHDMAAAGLALGFLGLSSIGSLTFLYVSSEDDEFNPEMRHLWHSLIPLAGSIGCFLVFNTPLDTWFYVSGTLILLIYLAFSWSRVIRYKENSKLKSWHLKLLVAVTLVALSFVYQHITATMFDYAIGSAIAGVAVYYIFIQALLSPLVFTNNMRVEASNEVIEKVKAAFELEDIYRKQAVTIGQVSNELAIPAYLITRAVKDLYDKSFPDAINYFRVNDVKQKLLENEDVKVEALAYDAGFNTPSAFYAAFKKYTGQSPKAFQQTQILQSA